ncbi:hypothetical protein CYMTET_46068 [Cymbomonas tetramitiformis]|uniref:Uncharacterized protein n=1 Tax=Cymbomonas tetramitiformis TaxID=36881 RepID=A0AAE0EXY7_9CHLO|nr:hypothetical protein CYMTET_46068 [Cymbomonas tetramitiformis]
MMEDEEIKLMATPSPPSCLEAEYLNPLGGSFKVESDATNGDSRSSWFTSPLSGGSKQDDKPIESDPDARSLNWFFSTSSFHAKESYW